MSASSPGCSGCQVATSDLPPSLVLLPRAPFLTAAHCSLGSCASSTPISALSSVKQHDRSKLNSAQHPRSLSAILQTAPPPISRRPLHSSSGRIAAFFLTIVITITCFELSVDVVLVFVMLFDTGLSWEGSLTLSWQYSRHARNRFINSSFVFSANRSAFSWLL